VTPPTSSTSTCRAPPSSSMAPLRQARVVETSQRHPTARSQVHISRDSLGKEPSHTNQFMYFSLFCLMQGTVHLPLFLAGKTREIMLEDISTGILCFFLSTRSLFPLFLYFIYLREI
jgi:hypothetical protein